MKQSTNKILLIVLVVLLSAFVVTKVFRSPARESNLDTDVFRIDTSRVEIIEVRQPGNNELTFRKGDSTWTIEQADKSANLASIQLDNLLRTMNNVRPERLVSRKKETWNEYQVSDSSAIRLTAYTGDMDELATWHIGKQSAGNTYMRSEDQEEVYLVEGAIRSGVDKDFNEWRDKSFLRIDKSFIDRISFQYPADSGFVLEKEGQGWMINDHEADSLKVQNYIGRLQSKDLSGFADDFSPSSQPDITVELSSNAVPHAVIKAWKTSEGGAWILNSALQPGVYFEDSVFFNDLFIGKAELQ